MGRRIGAAAAVLTAVVAADVALAVWGLPRGLDLTDEGYYLVACREGTVGITSFGAMVRTLSVWRPRASGAGR